jgi:transposase-like protein
VAESVRVTVPATKPNAAMLRRLYSDTGMRLSELGVRFGVSPQTVLKWLEAASVPRRAGAISVRTDLDNDDIRRLYVDGGCTAAEIAQQLGCAPSTVYHRLSRMGVSRRLPAPRHRSRPDETTLRRLYIEQGLTLRQVALRYAVSPQAVHGWLRAAGIQRRPSGAPAPPWDSADLVELYRQGWSGLRIARHFGCSTITVYERLERAGVPRRRGTPWIGRPELVEGLSKGLTAPQIAAAHSISVSCVCRALAREGLATASQAARRRHAAL